MHYTQNGVRFFVFASIVPFDYDPKELVKAPLMIVLISLKTVNVSGFDLGQTFAAFE